MAYGLYMPVDQPRVNYRDSFVFQNFKLILCVVCVCVCVGGGGGGKGGHLLIGQWRSKIILHVLLRLILIYTVRKRSVDEAFG